MFLSYEKYVNFTNGSNNVRYRPIFQCLNNIALFHYHNRSFNWDNRYILCTRFSVTNDDAGETEAIAEEEDEMTDPGNIIRSTDKNPFLNFNNFSHGLVY